MTDQTPEAEFDEHMKAQLIDFLSSEENPSLEDAAPFDIYAQPIQRWADKVAHIPGLVISSAGGLAPFQAEGLLHGMPFYFRSRHDEASLNVGSYNSSTPYLVDDALYHASAPCTGNFVSMLETLIPLLEKAPFLWKFEGLKPIWNSDNEAQGDKKWSWSFNGEKETVYGWGHTAAEGFLNAATPSNYLAEHGFTPIRQFQYWLEREVNPTPVNEDLRVWPEETPPFAVNPL